MAWYDDKSGVGATVTGSEWNTMTAFIIAASSQLLSLTTDASVAAGTVCYLASTGKMIAADADSSSSTAGMIGLAISDIAASTSGTFLLNGIYGNSGYSYTAGQTLFVSTTPGSPTSTQPSGSGDIVRIVGYALSSTSISFSPDNSYVELV